MTRIWAKNDMAPGEYRTEGTPDVDERGTPHGLKGNSRQGYAPRMVFEPYKASTKYQGCLWGITGTEIALISGRPLKMNMSFSIDVYVWNDQGAAKFRKGRTPWPLQQLASSQRWRYGYYKFNWERTHRCVSLILFKAIEAWDLTNF
jgi:hypothetical protein